MPKGEKTKAAPKGMSAVEVEVPSEGDVYPAKITQISVVPAKDIFGDKAKDPERPTLSILFDGPGGVTGNCALSAPGITPGGKVVVRNPKSNLFKFAKRYKKGPHVGQAIDVYIEESGFYRLKLE